MNEARGRQTVERLPDVEFAEARFIHEPGDIALAVDERNECLLLRR